MSLLDRQHGPLFLITHTLYRLGIHINRGNTVQTGILILADRQLDPLFLITHTWYQLGKHSQLGILILASRQYEKHWNTINWGYTSTGDTQSIGDTHFGSSSAWSTVSHYTHLISTGEAQSIGDIGISKQWSCQKFGGTCPASSMAPAPTLPGPDGELTALLHIPSCIWGREWGQGRPRHSRIQQIGDGTPFSIRAERSKARRRGHSGLTQRTSAVYAIWWWWWWWMGARGW